jgi:hypothetical protein
MSPHDENNSSADTSDDPVVKQVERLARVKRVAKEITERVEKAMTTETQLETPALGSGQDPTVEATPLP